MTTLSAEAQDGLPRQFVASLKILFDILDEEHTGLIRLRDIETRWSDEGVKDLPSGVMEGLRKVAPPSGLLTFENFVSGLKLALFRGSDQMKRRSVSAAAGNQKENRSPTGAAPGMLASAKHASSPNQPLQSSPANRQQGGASSEMSGQQGSLPASKHRSAIPHLQQKSPTDGRPATVAIKPQPNSGTANSNRHQYPAPSHRFSSDHTTPSTRAPPPRPDKSNHSPIIRKSGSSSEIVLNAPQLPPRDQRQNQKVVTDVKNWQRDWKNKGTLGAVSGRDRPQLSDDPQHAIYANIDQFQQRGGGGGKGQEGGGSAPQTSQQAPGRATVRRHGSGRRHTLQNGVDHNLVKRLQQLEEEEGVVRGGLAMVDAARDWYLHQLAALQQKQKMLARSNSATDNSLEAHQERMNFQRARISEVNMQLQTLIDSSEKGFPLHMNLAVTPSPLPAASDGAVLALRQHNRRLTQEVSEKSERITKLEQEKASLIRELFESRSKHKSTYDDTTFM